METDTDKQEQEDGQIFSKNGEDLKTILEKELDFKYGAASVKLNGRFRPIRAVWNFFLDLYCPY